MRIKNSPCSFKIPTPSTLLVLCRITHEIQCVKSWIEQEKLVRVDEYVILRCDGLPSIRNFVANCAQIFKECINIGRKNKTTISVTFTMLWIEFHNLQFSHTKTCLVWDVSRLNEGTWLRLTGSFSVTKRLFRDCAVLGIHIDMNYIVMVGMGAIFSFIYYHIGDFIGCYWIEPVNANR